MSLASELELRLDIELRKRGIAVTPQAKTTLMETLRLSASGLAGDSDTILAGLLSSGSYTFEALNAAGANIAALKSLSEASSSALYETDADSVDSLFEPSVAQEAMDRAVAENRPLETSDLLRGSITPRAYDERLTIEASVSMLDASINQINSPPMMRELQHRVAEVIYFVAQVFLPPGEALPRLLARRSRLTEDEAWKINKELGPYVKNGFSIEDLEWVESALNSWFTKRQVLLEPADRTLQIVEKVLGELNYATTHFARSGGDIQRLESGLLLASRLVPERDMPMVALILRDNRIYAQPFTYRDTALVTSPDGIGEDNASPFKLFRPQPVPALQRTMLSAFEQLISEEHVAERDIQTFLEAHPQFLLSLGYSSVRPHISLTPPGGQRMIPDFLLEVPGRNTFDILDLKLPQKRFAREHPYLRISDELSKAVAQLRAYSNFFEDARNRQNFQQLYGRSAFKPELIVVIGRSHYLPSSFDRINVERQLSGVRLLTYDELIEAAKARSLDI